MGQNYISSGQIHRNKQRVQDLFHCVKLFIRQTLQSFHHKSDSQCAVILCVLIAKQHAVSSYRQRITQPEQYRQRQPSRTTLDRRNMFITQIQNFRQLLLRQPGLFPNQLYIPTDRQIERLFFLSQQHTLNARRCHVQGGKR